MMMMEYWLRLKFLMFGLCYNRFVELETGDWTVDGEDGEDDGDGDSDGDGDE